MTNKKKYLVALAFIIIILIVGAFFIYSIMNSNKTETRLTPEGEISQTITDPEVVDSTDSSDGVNPNTDNSDLAAQLEPTDDMKKVISDNKNDVNNSDVIDQMTESYPSDVIPLYKATSAADSNDIVTDNGKPGWIAQYGSDATVPEISDFYKSLLSSTSGYSATETGDSKTYEGTVDNCYVKVTIAPNNPERTGLNDQSNVDIFIERQ